MKYPLILNRFFSSRLHSTVDTNKIEQISAELHVDKTTTFMEDSSSTKSFTFELMIFCTQFSLRKSIHIIGHVGTGLLVQYFSLSSLVWQVIDWMNSS